MALAATCALSTTWRAERVDGRSPVAAQLQSLRRLATENRLLVFGLTGGKRLDRDAAASSMRITPPFSTVPGGAGRNDTLPTLAHFRPFSPILDCGPQVQYLISDGDSHPWLADAVPVHAVGQILDREVGVFVGGGHPAPELRVVCRVDGHRSASAWRSATGSRNEHEPNDVATSRRARASSAVLIVCPRHSAVASAKRKASGERSVRTATAS